MADERSAAIDIIIKLAPSAAVAESKQRCSVEARVAELGLSIEPLHPSTSDPELATYFVAHLEPAALKGAIERLLACDGVEGAYVKPRGEPPERSVDRAR